MTIPTTVQRIPAGARNHPARLKSATASHTLARRSIHADDETHADHAPPLSFDDDANPRDGHAHRADDAAHDCGPRSLHAATPASEIHRAGRETFRASFADHPASLLIDAAASRSDPFSARSRAASIATKGGLPPALAASRPLHACTARSRRASPATVAPRLPPALVARSARCHTRPPSPRHAPCTRAPQNPAVRAGNGRAAAPARASGAVHRERPARPCRRVGKCDAIRTLPPSPRHAPCTLVPR